MPTSKVELYAAIRRDVRAGMSGRAIERRHGVGRRTIVAAVSSAWPAPRKKLPPRASKLDPFKPVVDAILRADLDAPRKQRHTEAVEHRGEPGVRGGSVVQQAGSGRDEVCRVCRFSGRCAAAGSSRLFRCCGSGIPVQERVSCGL